MGEQILSLKDRKTAISNSKNIRMLQTHVNNDIYNKYCLIHNKRNTESFGKKYQKYKEISEEIKSVSLNWLVCFCFFGGEGGRGGGLTAL